MSKVKGRTWWTKIGDGEYRYKGTSYRVVRNHGKVTGTHWTVHRGDERVSLAFGKPTRKEAGEYIERVIATYCHQHRCKALDRLDGEELEVITMALENLDFGDFTEEAGEIQARKMADARDRLLKALEVIA